VVLFQKCRLAGAQCDLLARRYRMSLQFSNRIQAIRLQYRKPYILILREQKLHQEFPGPVIQRQRAHWCHQFYPIMKGLYFQRQPLYIRGNIDRLQLSRHIHVYLLACSGSTPGCRRIGEEAGSWDQEESNLWWTFSQNVHNVLIYPSL
jgi:hypothetical protein